MKLTYWLEFLCVALQVLSCWPVILLQVLGIYCCYCHQTGRSGMKFPSILALICLTESQKDVFLSLKCSLWSLFAFLWGTAKDCGRKGQVTPGDAGKPLRFLVAQLTLLGRCGHLGRFFAKLHGEELHPGEDVLVFLISMGHCLSCVCPGTVTPQISSFCSKPAHGWFWPIGVGGTCVNYGVHKRRLLYPCGHLHGCLWFQETECDNPRVLCPSQMCFYCKLEKHLSSQRMVWRFPWITTKNLTIVSLFKKSQSALVLSNEIKASYIFLKLGGRYTRLNKMRFSKRKILSGL